jgi:hypothetical protein
VAALIGLMLCVGPVAAIVYGAISLAARPTPA